MAWAAFMRCLPNYPFVLDPWLHRLRVGVHRGRDIDEGTPFAPLRQVPSKKDLEDRGRLRGLSVRANIWQIADSPPCVLPVRQVLPDRQP
jgi:hypothetical protein